MKRGREKKSDEEMKEEITVRIKKSGKNKHSKIRKETREVTKREE